MRSLIEAVWPNRFSRIHPKKKYVLLVFSDVNKSPQLVSIVKTLMLQECLIKIILIGKKQIQIRKELLELGVDFKQVPNRRKFLSFFLFWTICSEIVFRKPNVLYASGQFASAIGIFCGFCLRVPSRVFTRHHSNYHHKYNLRFGVLVDRITSMMATSIVAVSGVVRSILIEIENVPAYKVVSIPNGIDLAKFSRSNIASKRKVAQECNENRNLKIGIIARMTDWKGVEYGAMAFKEFCNTFPNSHLTIIGAYSDSYEKIYAVLKTLPPKNYRLEEFRDDIPSFLAGLDIFIHIPTGLHDEAFGIVYVEALSIGTPSVFTISGVLQELAYPNKYAEIVAYKDSSAVLTSMLKIANGESCIESLVPDEWIQSFSINKMSQRYCEILLKMESK